MKKLLKLTFYYPKQHCQKQKIVTLLEPEPIRFNPNGNNMSQIIREPAISLPKSERSKSRVVINSPAKYRVFVPSPIKTMMESCVSNSPQFNPILKKSIVRFGNTCPSGFDAEENQQSKKFGGRVGNKSGVWMNTADGNFFGGKENTRF